MAISGVPADWKPDATLNPGARRELRDQLYPLALERCFVVCISGTPEACERKSRVAAELSLALAETGHPRILLMEGNFQSPRTHRLMRLEVPVAWGFSQQLHARVRGEIVHGWAVTACSPSLHVLAEGILRSPGLLLSKQFEQSVAQLRTYYDLIVIDGPDISSAVDCRALDALVDGVVLVSTQDSAPLLAARNAVFSDKRFSTVISAPEGRRAK